MSDVLIESAAAGPSSFLRGLEERLGSAKSAQYALALGLVAAATLGAFVVEQLVAAPNLALVFVLPVLISGLTAGWGPSLLAALASVAAFDVFFIAPRFSLRVDAPADMWALSLLLIIGAIASTVAAEARRRSREARMAADRAEALGVLAQLVVDGAAAQAVIAGARDALVAIFDAPAAVLVQDGGGLNQSSASRGATLTAVDMEAARWTLDNGLATHAQTYPFGAAQFDFWPVGRGVVVGVKLPERRDTHSQVAHRYVQLVGGYLVAGLRPPPARP